jgi:hypothetical protein
VTKRKKSTLGAKANIGGDFEGEFIQGNYNTINKSEFHGEEISQSLQEVSDALYNSTERPRWDQYGYDAEKAESRSLMETIFTSAVSGIVIGIIWQYTYPWISVLTLPVPLLTALTLSALRIIHLGVRHIFTFSVLFSVVFYILIEKTTMIGYWISTNILVGTIISGMLGAFAGLIIGIVLMFWKPLGD